MNTISRTVYAIPTELRPSRRKSHNKKEYKEIVVYKRTMSQKRSATRKDSERLCETGRHIGKTFLHKMRIKIKRTTILLVSLALLTVYIKLSRLTLSSDEKRDLSLAKPQEEEPAFVASHKTVNDGTHVMPNSIDPDKADPHEKHDKGRLTLEELLERHKMAPFEEGARKVLIVSYRGADGTLVGELIDNGPWAMHITEPLDGVYTAMYGSRDFVVAEDIMNNKDGSLRILPDGERDAVVNVLDDIYNCNIDGIPTDTLTHPYWFRKMSSQMSNLPLIECLKASTLVFHRQCRPVMMKDCPGRFDPSLPKTPKCKELLWDLLGGSRGGDYVGESDGSVTDTMLNYTACMKDARQKIERCERIMHTYCSNTKVRGVTAVRTSMDVAVPLMKKDPNFRVLHLVRNPQAIAAIRSKYDNNSLSYYGMGDPMKEAAMYCQQVKHDREVRQSLEESYPGKTLEIGYEEFINNPIAWTEFIFKFLDLKIDFDISEYITAYAPLLQKEVNEWYDNAPYNMARDIRDMCNIMWYGKAYDL